MSEHLLLEPDAKEGQELVKITTTNELGRITVLEALAEETDGISINASHRSTQMGNGVDAEDD